jgi:cytochrome P450
MTDTIADEGVDLLTPERVVDPYPIFAELREKHPVYFNPLYKAWFIHRYDDVMDALRDDRFSSDRIRPVYEHKLTETQREERGPTYEILGDWLVFRDPPDHTRLRKLVSRAFTPRAVEQLRERTEVLVAEMVAEVAPRGEIDLIHDFAYPIPAVIIAEMLGVPAADRDMFKDWSDDVMVLVFGARDVEGRRERAQQGLVDLRDYLSGMVKQFRAEPQDNLITALVKAQEGDDALTDREIVSNCVLFLFGGHETTTNLIGNGTRALLRHPDQLAKFKADPDLLKPAVEEMLRYDGPSKMQVRMASADIEMRGETIREGDMVYLVQAAANHDPEVFEDPEKFDVTRNPTGQIGFGFGIHFCLGASVARLEGAIAINALVRALDDLHLGPGAEHWHPTLISRGMESLPVSFTPVEIPAP